MGRSRKSEDSVSSPAPRRSERIRKLAEEVQTPPPLLSPAPVSSLRKFQRKRSAGQQEEASIFDTPPPSHKKLKRKEKILMQEMRIEKMKEKLRKDKIILKAEKKARKQQSKDRLKSRVAAVMDNVSLSRKMTEDLPSASDYSDLESPDEGAR